MLDIRIENPLRQTIALSKFRYVKIVSVFLQRVLRAVHAGHKDREPAAPDHRACQAERRLQHHQPCHAQPQEHTHTPTVAQEGCGSVSIIHGSGSSISHNLDPDPNPKYQGIRESSVWQKYNMWNSLHHQPCHAQPQDNTHPPTYLGSRGVRFRVHYGIHGSGSSIAKEPDP